MREVVRVAASYQLDVKFVVVFLQLVYHFNQRRHPTSLICASIHHLARIHLHVGHGEIEIKIGASKQVGVLRLVCRNIVGVENKEAIETRNNIENAWETPQPIPLISHFFTSNAGYFVKGIILKQVGTHHNNKVNALRLIAF